MNWSHITMTMPWGTHVYRYRDLALSGWPRSVEINIKGEWLACPNVNAAKRIQRCYTPS